MKKYLITLYCLLVTYYSFSQNNSKEYTDLMNRGTALYKIKDYKNSAQAFSSAFQLKGAMPAFLDRWSAACSWSLANYTDSAFVQLYFITVSNDLNFWDVDQIITDEDFIPLHTDNRWENVKNKLFNQLNSIVTSAGLKLSDASNYVDKTFEPDYQDKRWQDIKDNMYLKIYEGFLTALKQNAITFTPSDSDQLALARALADNPDSAFAHLNDPAFVSLRQKEYDKAYKFIEVSINVFPNNYWLNQNMGDYYLEKGEKEMAFDYYSKALNLKYHVPSVISYTRNIDSAIAADYTQLFKQTGHKLTHASKRILIDEGHYEYHTLAGSFDELAGILRKDGFVVSSHKSKFNLQSLTYADILIISNPNPQPNDTLIRKAKASGEPLRWSADAILSSFTDAEVAIVKDWVLNGGSLFLILDHAPHGANGSSLAAAFGVETRNVETRDSLHQDPTGNKFTILFTRKNGMIGNHPILTGVDSVVTYFGESLLGSKETIPLLLLSSTTTDRDWLSATRQFRFRSAAGRSQGMAIEYGKGRVIVLGEAGMLISNPGTDKTEQGTQGIGRSDRGNKKFTLNIIKWLAKLN